MNKIEFATQALRDGLRWVSSHIDPTPLNPSDAAVIIAPLADGKVIFGGGNEQRSARARVPATGDVVDGLKAVHAGSLNTIVKTAPGQTVTLEFRENEMIVKSGPARSKLTYMKTGDRNAFTAAPNIPAQGTIPGAVLINAVNALAPVAKEDASNPALAGVKVNLQGDQIDLATIDKYLLATASVEFNTSKPNLELDTLVPATILATIARDLPADEDVTLHFSDDARTRLALSTGDRWVAFGVLASRTEFPDYKSLNVGEVATTFEMDRKELAATLARAAQALGRDRQDFRVDVETTDEAASSFNVTANGLFEHAEQVTARVTGKSAKLDLSAQYVTMAVKAVGGDTITLEVGERLAQITSDHPAGISFVLPPKIAQ